MPHATFGHPITTRRRRSLPRNPAQLGLALPLTPRELRAALVILPGGAQRPDAPMAAPVLRRVA